MKAFRESQLEHDRQYCLDVLEMTRGNVTHAASIAGKNRTDMYKLLKRCGVQGSGITTPPKLDLTGMATL